MATDRISDGKKEGTATVTGSLSAQTREGSLASSGNIGRPDCLILLLLRYTEDSDQTFSEEGTMAERTLYVWPSGLGHLIQVNRVLAVTLFSGIYLTSSKDYPRSSESGVVKLRRVRPQVCRFPREVYGGPEITNLDCGSPRVCSTEKPPDGLNV